MATRQILLNNGVVSSRPAVMLGDGELSEGVNVEYRPNSPTLWKVNGHESFAQINSAGGCYGMFHLKFDNADPVLLVGVAFSYAGGPPRTLWGGYLNITNAAISSGVALSDENRLITAFDCVNYLDRYYVLFGGDLLASVGERRNFYVDSSIASDTVTDFPKFHGMMQNTEKPTIVFGSSSNPGVFTLTGANRITYWIEERVKDSLGNIIKRNSGSAATTVSIGAGVDISVFVHRPAVVNSDATHWALYATSAAAAYPVGFQVAENEIGGAPSQYKINDQRTGSDPVAPPGPAYKTVTAVLNGVSLTVPRFGAMPKASLGDVFEDCLVTNDLDAPKYIAWSYTGDPQAFPSIYRMALNSKEGDTITMIRRVGGSLIIGMSDSVWRMSTLPKFSDSSFDSERAKSQIEGAHGAISQQSSCLYSSMDGIRLAYVSNYGIRSTDGSTWFDASADMDWPGTVAVDKLSACFMLNNPAKYRLEFYYADSTVNKLTYNLGGSVTFNYIPNKCVYLHYHPSHQKPNGAMKVTGPHAINATAGCVVSNGTNREVWLNVTPQDVLASNLIKTGVIGSGIYTEHGVERSIDMSVKSGEYYLAGPHGETNVGEVVVNHTAGQNQQEASVTLTTRAEGRADLTDGATIPVEREGQSTVTTGGYGLGSSHKLGVTNSDGLGTFGINYISIEHTPSTPLGGFAKSDG